MLMLWSLKRGACIVVSVCICVAVCVAICAVRAVKICVEAPELVFLSRNFYLYSPSSQAEIKKELAWYEWSEIEGESVEYAILEGAGTDLLAYAREKFQDLGGVEAFVEEVDGTVSVYGYAPKLYGGITLYGERVNLHVAARADRLVVGSPIIFGGF